MKKTFNSKLALKKVTVSDLNADEMGVARGGSSFATQMSECIGGSRTSCSPSGIECPLD
ncbi:MAG: hypothetical protein GY765_20825 [bacterium]|nr:hypothetical protein [bacterium]